MSDSRFHEFEYAVQPDELPGNFTFPFNYVPVPIAVKASQLLMHYLECRDDWHSEINEGKMFGVLIVKSTTGKIGFLAAFSGNIMHHNNYEYFVPPIYDLLNPSGFFVEEEANISEINSRIKNLESTPRYVRATALHREIALRMGSQLNDAKLKYNKDKQQRAIIRKSTSDSYVLKEMERISQFQKAEIKRLKQKWQKRLDAVCSILNQYTQNINGLKKERQSRSKALQLRLFDQFRVLNALGEEKALPQLFACTPQGVPPAGAGECAAPKLLQYAYLNGMKPIAMAEFWWGKSPVTEIRRHGCYYPACRGKCFPILSFMMQGLTVDSDPLGDAIKSQKLHILYEDNDMIAVDKPIDMLSVPGKVSEISVPQLLRMQLGKETQFLPVHRLDAATSGVLLLAKNPQMHKILQSMFADRSVSKIYNARLDGIIKEDSGIISLPIAPHPHDRPRQIVDHECGKVAITHFKVLNRDETTTNVEFSPITGRTHQLRVHSAHHQGLNAPIIGDNLYGSPSTRMMLHALSITFVHPYSSLPITIMAPQPF